MRLSPSSSAGAAHPECCGCGHSRGLHRQPLPSCGIRPSHLVPCTLQHAAAARPIMPACCAAGGGEASTRASAGAQESTSFSNVLRKGFQPRTQKQQQQQQQQQEQQQPAHQGIAVEGRVKVLGGGSSTEAGWLEVDKEVNQYPSHRTFTAIGTGGDQFRASVVRAVEEVTGETATHSERPSSGGKYLAVRVSVSVQSAEQVIAIFAAIKKDARVKWMM